MASYRVLLECLYVLAHLLAPLLPVATTEILRRLGTSAMPAADLSPNFNNLAAGTPVHSTQTIRGTHHPGSSTHPGRCLRIRHAN